MKTTLLLFTLIVKALLSYGQAAELRQLLAVPYDKVKKDLCRLSYKATTFIYDMNDPRETCDTIHSTVSLDQQGMEILSEYGFSIQRNDTQIVVDHATRSITLSRVQWSYDKLCQQAAQSLLEDCVPVKIFCRTRSGFVDFTIKYKNGSLLDSAQVRLYGDNIYAYKFENNNNGSLFELAPSSASSGNREIGNRIDYDLELNPVGSGGITINCDKVSIDNLNGVRTVKVYGSNTLKSVVGTAYTMTVNFGGKIYTSTSTARASVAIDSGYTVPNFRGDGVRPVAALRDPAGVTNYYKGDLYKNGEYIRTFEVADDDSQMARRKPFDLGGQIRSRSRLCRPCLSYIFRITKKASGMCLTLLYTLN